MSDPSRHILDAVTAARQVRGWSLRRLAEEVGVSHVTMRRWASGGVDAIPVRTLARLLDVLDLDMTVQPRR